jgi:hypothetical protein
MIKKIWDRRRRQERRHNHGDNIHSPHGGKVKGHRKKGVRRKRATTLLLGLTTIMPIPSAKVAQRKKSRNQEITYSFPGLNKPGNVLLWTPPSFENQFSESESTVTPIPNDIQAQDLMPYSEIVYPLALRYNVDWRLVAAVLQAESVLIRMRFHP